MIWSIMESPNGRRDVRAGQRGALIKEGGKGKSSYFSLCQALAYPVVRKGSNFESVFCGLSPPCFWGRGPWPASIPFETLNGSPTQATAIREFLVVADRPNFSHY